MTITYNPQPLTADQLLTLSQEVKRALTALYGERLERVILYGSYARGDFHAESDVDYLVVLRDEVVHGPGEVWVFGETATDLTDTFGVLVSFKAASLKKYGTSDLLFYQNVRREGIPL